ncbi:class I SAM-dependent methyltransferase [Aestuariibacter sp. AA17]|uniref:Ribosomal RNA small subunit methyltransferase C n=2 Tax=Fluctibacter corallii TaxID=2984329 RepID=A0ABT3AAR2_9ALTE|nr:class I SAM-dependent methyltransferase [Aestuariibacter sp. AA17]
MLSAPSQVLVRNASLFSDGKWALVNAADAAIFNGLPEASLCGFHQFYDIYEQAQQTSRCAHTFSADFAPEERLDGAVIYMPKAKKHAAMLIANIAACIKPNGTLMLVGENKSGIKSAAKLLESVGSQVNKIDSARHCALFATQIDNTVKPFVLADWVSEQGITFNGNSIQLTSLPGVFSHGELDAGTALLLEEFSAQPDKNVLDFACGNGVIGICMATLNPSINLTMTDVSALALYCAERSVAANNVKATIIPSNGLSNIEGKFNRVYTNPPFHTGIKTDYSITEKLIKGLSTHMHNDAKLTLVANRFLKYPDLLEATFKHFATIAQTSKFSLYHAVK